MEKYTNGIFFWQCETCENRWHAHGEGTALHEQADPFIKRTMFRMMISRDFDV